MLRMLATIGMIHLASLGAKRVPKWRESGGAWT
jgi:hypothetical protein